MKLIKTYFDKAKIIIQNKGFLPLLVQAFKKIKFMSFQTNCMIWFVKDLNEKAQRLNGFSDFEINFHGFEEIVDFMKKNNSKYPWMYNEKEMVLARECGHLIPFLKINNSIVGYTKVGLRKVYIRDYDCVFTLGSNKAIFYDTTMLPEHRGKKLPRYLKNEIYGFLEKRRIDKIYGLVEPWNIGSIKSVKGAGFKELGSNRYIRIFCFKFHSNNPKKFLS